ncbi:MAG: MFS transporter [Pseudomonadota bacterium]
MSHTMPMIRCLLLLMTTMAVIGDALLMPFYPQFFAERFGVHNPQSAGNYLAAICFTVMLAFPCWAHLSKKIPTLFIMFATQAVAGILALLCYWVESWPLFWFLSLAMFMCKAGYLLIYPLLMQLEPEENHARTIGMVSIIVHFGAILGALVGGIVLQITEASEIYCLMAASDFVAMFCCVYLWRNFGEQFDLKRIAPNRDNNEHLPANNKLGRSWRVYRLGAVMLFFYFAANITCPFFVSFWQTISTRQSTVWSGMIYAIPGIMALCVLWLTRRKNIQIPTLLTLGSALVISIIGYALQNIATEAAVIIGRIIFGVGIYYASIYLELLIFHGGDKDAYATDVSRVYFFQSLGVLLSSYSAGILVNHTNLQASFYVGSFFLVMTFIIFWSMKFHLIPKNLSPQETLPVAVPIASKPEQPPLIAFKGVSHDY